jgi:two-component sensor histidine kinase
VSLRSLISELGANLRATAPASASAMQIRLDVEPFYATQDVAVSVAFLITELVEYAMFCCAGTVSISLEAQSEGFALLTVESAALGGEQAQQTSREARLQERFERIVIGLARQLRSNLERDPEHGRYALPIAVVGRGDA